MNRIHLTFFINDVEYKEIRLYLKSNPLISILDMDQVLRNPMFTPHIMYTFSIEINEDDLVALKLKYNITILSTGYE